MDWYFMAFRKYAEFSGRSMRIEYWMFALINLVVTIVLAVVDSVVFGSNVGSGGVFGAIYSLGVLIPSIAVGVRRLHDTNRSGWWLLIALIPIIGIIVLIIFFVQDSQAGPNQYGPNPKEGSPAPAV